MKWVVCDEEEKGGVFRLICLCVIVWICFCKGKIDSGKDFGFMCEGRVWEFSVSMVFGFLKFDFLNLFLNRLFFELYRIRLDGEWFLLVGFVVLGMIIVLWKWDSVCYLFFRFKY